MCDGLLATLKRTGNLAGREEGSISLPWDPYSNLDPRCPEQGVAFFTIGGCYKTGTALGVVGGLQLSLKETQSMVVLWGDTEGFMDLLYGALGVITEETQGAEDDPNTMATGTGTSKPYRSTGGLCGIATHRLEAHRVLHTVSYVLYSSF
uniref:Uncharacterized protein n=1 Tax=Accipiter nisus TaxID=211598 RepID=A0A8B9MRX3_9AVES